MVPPQRATESSRAPNRALRAQSGHPPPRQALGGPTGAKIGETGFEPATARPPAGLAGPATSSSIRRHDPALDFGSDEEAGSAALPARQLPRASPLMNRAYRHVQQGRDVLGTHDLGPHQPLATGIGARVALLPARLMGPRCDRAWAGSRRSLAGSAGAGWLTSPSRRAGAPRRRLIACEPNWRSGLGGETVCPTVCQPRQVRPLREHAGRQGLALPHEPAAR
jgi:hypothetical protein